MRKLQVLFSSAFLLCLPFVFSCAGGSASSEDGSDVAIILKTSFNHGGGGLFIAVPWSQEPL